MDSKKTHTAGSLTDYLVVEILSRVPFKSFCCFKCVCKVWQSFSSNPHYRQKLPKIPTGILRGGNPFPRGKDVSASQLVTMSPNDEEIDGALTFLPHHEHLEFEDYCNGLVLCKYKSSYTSPDICRFIVCNPATREWRTLPDIHRGSHDSTYTALLAFDPSWSTHFYVFNFEESFNGNCWAPGNRITKLEVFSSKLSTWVMDAAWSSRIVLGTEHFFIGGVLHVNTNAHEDEMLVLEGLEAMSTGIPPHHFIIKLPHDPWRLANGCFGQSSGFLQCAFPDESGNTVTIFSLDTYHPYQWSLKHRFSMRDAFGMDDFVQVFEMVDYKIIALDLERDVLFLIDNRRKLLSYNINTEKLTKIQDDFHNCFSTFHYYVACYSKLPG